jgi:iron complex outermembrane recepter protein
VKTTYQFGRRASLRLGVASAVMGVALISSPAFAQAAEGEEASEEIFITGSRIARPNVESAAPVTVIGAEDFKGQGAVKVEDLLNNLPQVLATQSSGVSNGADGTATVSLRGLGTSRTVVLVDGRRLMPGGIAGGAGADLNFIPSALISSVEILTGGASSTYGADAVAGVVNFKMNRKFQGVRLDAQYGMYQHDNQNPIRSIVNNRFRAPEGSALQGGAYDVTLAIGSSLDDDRGNIVAYAGLRRDSAITQDGYDYSICTLNPSGPRAATTGAITDFACGGSGTPAATRFGGLLDPTALRVQARGPVPAGSPTGTLGPLRFEADGVTPILAPAAELASQTLLASNGLIPYSGLRDAYNFAPLNYFRRPSTRYTAGVFADYEISPALKPYIDAMFMDYSTKAQIAPSGAFYGVRSVNCNNPLLLANAALAALACQTPGATLGSAPVSVVGTPTVVDILIGKRNVEGGPRFNDIGFSQFRVTTGMKGDLSDKWSYDVSAQFGQVSAANTYRNDVSSTRIDEALLATGTLANPVCTSGNPSCVPYNPFVTGGVTAAAAAYIGIPLVITGKVKETIISGSTTGDLGFSSPGSDENVKVALGAEWRKEELSTQPDLSYINGDGAGQGGPTLPINGSYTVRDIFAEAVVPIISDKAFFQDLSLELGFRNSSYNVQGNPGSNSENTWKIAANWTMTDFLKVRGSRNRAVRSPNINELFLNQSVGLFAGTDPCVNTGTNGNLPPVATLAQCLQTGLTAGQYGTLAPNTAQQYNGNFGGNLNVTPEKSDSWTAGFVLTPTDKISVSVDYYNIKVKNAISTIGAQLTLDQCVATGDPFFCSKIRRAPASAGPAAGSLWLDESGFVDDRTVNTGSLKTSGVDVNVDARFALGSGNLKATVVGNYVDKFTIQPLTGSTLGVIECAGFYGTTCGNQISPQPKWKHAARLKYSTANDFGVTLGWRYVGSVKVDSSDAAPKIDDKLKAENYFDLLFSVPLKDTIGFRLGVNNILDNDPPLVSQSSLGGFGNGNVFPGTYDHLGRYIFVGVTADF